MILSNLSGTQTEFEREEVYNEGVDGRLYLRYIL
jgi:hypothetical protein